MISESAIKNVVNKAFDALGSAAGVFYIKTVTNTFDPTTSETVTSTTTTESKGVLDTTRVYYLNEQALSDPHYVLWLKATAEPKMSDVIVDSSNNEYNIVKITKMKTNTETYIYRIGLRI